MGYANANTNANSCNKLIENSPSIKVHPSDYPVHEIQVSVCDLRKKFDQNEFPSFFLALHQGLKQPENSAEMLEMALTLANETIDAGDFEKGEKIYQIILGILPLESRAMSSYAALHILKEEYETALELLTKAAEISPTDPLILNNLYFTNLLLGKYEEVSKTNKALLRLEPDDRGHILKRALIDKLYVRIDNDKSWGKLIAIQKNENNKDYWINFAKELEQAKRTQNVEELIYLGDQWISNGMSSEALLLFDYAAKLTLSSEAYYLKAKAFEHDKYYKLAFSAAQKAREIELSKSELNKELYEGILYEVARLAYAVNDYQKSLQFFDEYVSKGYSHSHIDYMYGVNLAALGKLEESKPYFQKCITEPLPSYMLDFCEEQLSKNRVSSSAGKAKELSTAVIKISKDEISPLDYLKRGKKEELVSWLGEIIDVEMTESAKSVHIRWTAKLLKPNETIEIVDGKSYEIRLAPTQSEELFSVDLYLDAFNEKVKEDIKENFSKEKYIIARGNAHDIRVFKDQLSVSMAPERAIFTSKILIVNDRNAESF